MEQRVQQPASRGELPRREAMQSPGRGRADAAADGVGVERAAAGRSHNDRTPVSGRGRGWLHSGAGIEGFTGRAFARTLIWPS